MTTDKTMKQLSEMLEKGETSSTEVVKGYLEHIKAHNKAINAYITVNEEAILKEAAASDARRQENKALSPFDGIPVAVKDNINTEGLRTTCGSKILENFVPPFSATAYENMKKKGLLLLGKTNLDEFAMGSTTETSYFGAVQNPYDRDRVPGGSSGGSAAAVAARMAPVSLGSDTGGSIRQPAAFCGVVGIKPTYGMVSRFGLVAFASSLDQIGTFGTTVEDAGALLSIISGEDPKDSTSIKGAPVIGEKIPDGNIDGKVIGVPEEYFNGIDDEINEAVKKQIAALESQGAKIEKVSLKYTEYAIPVYYLIATAEASSNLARYDGVRYGYRSEAAADLNSLYLKSRSEGFGKEVKRRIILGTFSLSSGYYDAYYLKALQGRKLIIEDFKAAFEKVDALVTPTTTSTAFRNGEMVSDPLQMYMSDILTISANLAGIPGISVPVGMNSSGLPMGLQIMGNHFQEDLILNIARAVEKNCEIPPPSL